MAYQNIELDVSADGKLIVGWGASEKGLEAVRWLDGVPKSLGVATRCRPKCQPHMRFAITRAVSGTVFFEKRF